MKKRFLALALILAIVFGFCACKDNAAPEAENDDDKVETPDAPVEESTAALIKIGVIYSGNPDEEYGASASHEQSVVAMRDALGLTDDSIVRKTEVSVDNVAAALEECVAEGCALVLGTDMSYAAAFETFAAKNPEIYFSCEGIGSATENYNRVYARIYQAAYLAGIAAGLRTETGLVGYVRTSDGKPLTYATINAFAMGVERGNPEAKVLLRCVEAGGEYDAAASLADAGCDVLADFGTSSAGVQSLAAERELWNCGSGLAENNEYGTLTSLRWNWGIYYTLAAKTIIEGSRPTESEYGGLSDGLADITALANCASGTKDAVEEAKAEILNGRDVFTGDITASDGRIVCTGEDTLDDSAIIGMNWLYRNVVE